MNRTRRQRETARRVDLHTAGLFARLAAATNARPRTDRLQLAWRYLRRFHRLLDLCKGSRHIARPDFGPMLYERPDGTLAADPRTA